MAKLQGKYESVIIISTKLSEEEVKAVVTKITDLISANGTLERLTSGAKEDLLTPSTMKPRGTMCSIISHLPQNSPQSLTVSMVLPTVSSVLLPLTWTSNLLFGKGVLNCA